MKYSGDTIPKPIRKLEQLLKNVITGGNRFNAFCDSKINFCYYCCLFRIKLRRQKPPFFLIFTKYAVYTFLRFPNSPHITIATARNKVWNLANVDVDDGKIHGRI